MKSTAEAVELLFGDRRTGIRIWPDGNGNVERVEILCDDVVVVDNHAERTGRVKVRAFAKQLLEATALKAVPRPVPCNTCLGAGWMDSPLGAENPALRESCKACDGTGHREGLEG